MARIFITGSADGLGFLAARRLLALGHEVLFHARNAARAQELRNKLTGPIQLVTGDLSNMEQTIELANAVNKAGSFDVHIHNAGVYQANPKTILHVNTIAPYILTCLIQPPQRLIYLSSNMHLQGRLHSAQFKAAPNQLTYSDSKFHMVLLAKAIARKWPAVFSNAVDPGWVPTKMGGSGAPDNLEKDMIHRFGWPLVVNPTPAFPESIFITCWKGRHIPSQRRQTFRNSFWNFAKITAELNSQAEQSGMVNKSK